MLAFAHHVADIAEHKEIAGNRPRQARDIVGVPGHKTGRKTLGKMRGRIFVRDGVAHPLQQFIANGDVFLSCEFDKAVGEIGVVGGEGRLDILFDDVLVISQGRTELEISEFR